ncbi:hypothetical protein LCI18_003722 [Fusarium solani-melongenae]|uniref:Uncharacterized protein n=1 Tax=Fusarium solani subsp. cucurbitae TaxID=2747967 RepID=A0ACD3YUY9_FUSSC|nr:hypothetical protein LCI18_003722 [Fusarium solani-melongenae]
MTTKIHDLLKCLTLEEKIALLAGGGFWESCPIPEKGIPAFRISDGPNGARGPNVDGNLTSACFPAACSVASTFDRDLAKRIGIALGEETISKGAICISAPTVCIHRHPLGGRNFESFSEDPLLTGKLASQTILGLQSVGVAACIKHFVANEQETQRLSVNEIIDERTLREIYLRPFEIAIKEANPHALMTSYNQINYRHVDREWGWDGLTISDWGGTNSVADGLIAGLDLEMPGPARWRTAEQIRPLIEAGQITEAVIDERATRILRFLDQGGCFKNPHYSPPDEKAIDKPEHQSLIREAGAKGIVLLKNDNHILPLTKEKLKGKKVGVFGYAKEPLVHGGGSTSVNSHYKISPWDALHQAFADNDLPLLSDHVVNLQGEPGFTCTIHEPNVSEPIDHIRGILGSAFTLDHVTEHKDVKLVGVYTAPETGKFYFTLSGLGPSKLFMDGKLLVEQEYDCTDSMAFLFGGVAVPQNTVQLEAGTKYEITITTQAHAPTSHIDLSILEDRAAVRLGWMAAEEHDTDILTEAVELAKKVDYCIAFTGNDPSWETEGQDQGSFSLPKDGSQDSLVAGIAAANPGGNVIVVNSTGVAVSMPWIDQVKGLLQVWFPGQEAGNSIVDVLTGAVTPEGHLTCTFAKSIEAYPAHGNFPGTYEGRQLTVEYREGIFVGYRHFDRIPAEETLFPFGFGLSYTTFEISGFEVQNLATNEYVAHATVANTGTVNGGLAVQLYVGVINNKPNDPIKALVAFEKVRLEPGASTVVELPVQTRDFASWDDTSKTWRIDEGLYQFSIGKSSRDLVAEDTVEISSQTWQP